MRNEWEMANREDKLKLKLPEDPDIWEPLSELNEVELTEGREADGRGCTWLYLKGQ